MKIAGFQKNSFVDFPGQLCAVIFTPGCNMNCWYCHNHGIKEDESLSFESIVEFLSTRKGMIDGVVFTGGEVTLQSDLEDAIRTIKDMGFLIKLDSNGLNPQIIMDLINKNLIDYIAMDIKAPFNKYKQVAQVDCDIDKLKQSIKFIMECGIDYEFRTTMSPDLLVDDIREIARNIYGAKKYAIQQYRQKCYDKILEQVPHEPSYIRLAAENAKPFVKEVAVRGL